MVCLNITKDRLGKVHRKILFFSIQCYGGLFTSPFVYGTAKVLEASEVSFKFYLHFQERLNKKKWHEMELFLKIWTLWHVCKSVHAWFFLIFSNHDLYQQSIVPIDMSLGLTTWSWLNYQSLSLEKIECPSLSSHSSRSGTLWNSTITVLLLDCYLSYVGFIKANTLLRFHDCSFLLTSRKH